MRKIWLVFTHDYLKNVRQKGFLIALFSLPLFISFSVGLGYFMRSQEESSQAIGYVDFSGLFNEPLALSSVTDRETVEISQLPDLTHAEDLLRQRDIQAYFVIPENYPTERDVEFFYIEEPGDNATRDFFDFMQLNLMNESPYSIQKRVASGTNSIIRTADGSREYPGNDPSLDMFLPLIIGLGFVMLLLISSGYLMSGFMDEKSNRTIEIIYTSISPRNLILGKLLTMFAIGLTMLVTWSAVGFAAYLVGGRYLELNWMKELSLDWSAVATILAVALPSYIFAAAIMLGIGFLLGNSQEAESIGPIFFMIAFIPIMFIGTIANDMNGPLAILFSVLPVASILTIGLRNMFIEIPAWQMMISVAIQLLFVTGAIWLVTKTFKMGMLGSGSRIHLRQMLRYNQHSTSEKKL
jgi:ABC-2 type transport system permease protein